jgi:hypothetical protein
MFSKNIGIWAEGSYVMGPKSETTIRTYAPNGQPDENGFYDIGNVQEGVFNTRTYESKNNAYAVKGGIVISIGGGKKNEISTEGDGTKATGGTPTSITTTKYKPTEIYEPPIITSPINNEIVSVSGNTLLIQYTPSTACNVNYKVKVWDNSNGKKLIYDQLHKSNFNGKITGLKLKESSKTQLSVQMQAIPCDACGTCSGDKQKFQNSSNTVIKNNGNSNVVNVTSSPCSNNGNTLEIKIDSAKCLNNKETKVWGHTKYTRVNPASTETNIGFKSLVIDGVSQPLPASLTSLPASSGVNQSFDFTISGNYCDKEIGLQDTIFTTCNYGGISNPDPVSASDFYTLPCCYCDYCDDKTIINTDSTATVSTTSNLLQIHQAFTLNPTNITKISAEIIYMSEDDSLDMACRTCAKGKDGENAVFHFYGSNTAIWNGAVTNAQASNSDRNYPTKAIEWSFNNRGEVELDMNIALPGISGLSCCNHKGQVCIRYYFTDVNCKTCEYFVCYNYGTQD